MERVEKEEQRLEGQGVPLGGGGGGGGGGGRGGGGGSFVGGFGGEDG